MNDVATASAASASPAADSATAATSGAGSAPASTPAPADAGDAAAQTKAAVASDGRVDIGALLGEELTKDETVAQYLKAENPAQELAKALINAKKLIGKPKVGVPTDKATPEERAAFFKELGVPDDEKGYEFAKPEGVPDEAYDAAHAEKWAKLFKENNVPKAAAAVLRDALFEEYAAEALTSNAELNKRLDAAFGERKSALSKEIGDVMQKAIPDAETRELVSKALGNKDLPAFTLAVGHVIEHMKKTYGQADSTNGDTSFAAGKSVDEMRAEARNLEASQEARDTTHPNYAETRRKAAELYKQIAAAMESQKRK